MHLASKHSKLPQHLPGASHDEHVRDGTFRPHIVSQIMRLIQSRGEPFLSLGDSGIGILLLHGWTSAPQDMLDLGKHLAERKHTVLGIRLPGHATRPADLNRMRWQDWMAAVEDGYGLLNANCEQVIVMGLSLGGALSLILAATHPVAGVVAMATPYEVPPRPEIRWLRYLLPIVAPLSTVLRSVPKPPINDYKDQQAYRDHVSYSTFPLRSLPEVDKLLKELRERMPAIQAPALLMHAIEDRGVSPENARSIFEQVGSREKELIWIENSGHVITLEPARNQVYELAASFVDRIANGAG